MRACSASRSRAADSCVVSCTTVVCDSPSASTSCATPSPERGVGDGDVDASSELDDGARGIVLRLLLLPPDRFDADDDDDDCSVLEADLLPPLALAPRAFDVGRSFLSAVASASVRC